jgi:hypothetical protein
LPIAESCKHDDINYALVCKSECSRRLIASR